MYIKIYFNDEPLFITNQIEDELRPYFDKNDTLVYKSFENVSVPELISGMQKDKINAGIVMHDTIEEVLNNFKKEVLFIQAAGGFIYTDDEILLIFRRGKWDLPKGKLDDNENLEEAALREVEEETGIRNVFIGNKLCITYHTYYQDKSFVLKESHWYLMKASEKEVLTPQTEEDIEMCTWVRKDELAYYMQNTHPSIRYVIEQGLKKL